MVRRTSSDPIYPALQSFCTTEATTTSSRRWCASLTPLAFWTRPRSVLLLVRVLLADFSPKPVQEYMFDFSSVDKQYESYYNGLNVELRFVCTQI